MSNSKVRFDVTHLAQMEHDPDAKAKRVKMIDTEMEIAVSADDGDSVEIRPMRQVLEVAPQQEVDCSKYYAICAYGPTAPDLWVSPDAAGEEWYNLGTVNIGQTIAITATRLKFNQQVKLIMRT